MILLLLFMMQRVKARRNPFKPRSEMVDNIVMALQVRIDSHPMKVLGGPPIPEI